MFSDEKRHDCNRDTKVCARNQKQKKKYIASDWIWSEAEKEREKKLMQIKNSHHTLIMYAFVVAKNKILQLCTLAIGLLVRYVISLRIVDNVRGTKWHASGKPGSRKRMIWITSKWMTTATTKKKKTHSKWEGAKLSFFSRWSKWHTSEGNS